MQEVLLKSMLQALSFYMYQYCNFISDIFVHVFSMAWYAGSRRKHYVLLVYWQPEYSWTLTFKSIAVTIPLVAPVHHLNFLYLLTAVINFLLLDHTLQHAVS